MHPFRLHVVGTKKKRIKRSTGKSICPCEAFSFNNNIFDSYGEILSYEYSSQMKYAIEGH